MEELDNLSVTLKNLRKDAGLTQKELSMRLGLGQATIVGYEKGQREPNIVSLIAYADYFECSLDYLLGRTDDFGNVVVKEERTSRGNYQLSEDERRLIDDYRILGAIKRARLAGYIEGLRDKKNL